MDTPWCEPIKTPAKKGVARTRWRGNGEPGGKHLHNRNRQMD